MSTVTVQTVPRNGMIRLFLPFIGMSGEKGLVEKVGDMFFPALRAQIDYRASLIRAA